MKRFRTWKQVDVVVAFSPEDRELIRRGDVYDPSKTSDLRTLVRVAVSDLLDTWAERERDEL